MRRPNSVKELLTILLVGAGIAAALLGASLTRAAGTAPGFHVTTTYTVSGDLTVGSVATLDLTLTNDGIADYPYDGSAWILLPRELKRTNTPVDILCESYRGHQGGLSQAVYNDFCRIPIHGPIAVGGSVDVAFPVKLLAEGTYNTQAETATGVPYTDPCCIGLFYPDLVRVSLDVTVLPAPPKVGGGGGGTTTGLPDLQATARASTGSPARGAAFTETFTVKNAGKIESSNVTFAGEVPAGLAVAAASSDSGACSTAPNATTGGTTVSCSVPLILVGQAANVTVSLSGAGAGTYASTGTFTSGNGDSSTGNNTASVSVGIK